MTTQPTSRTAEDLLFHKSGTAFPAGWVETVSGMEHPEVEPLPLRLPVIKGSDADFAVIVRRPGPSHVLHIEHWGASVDLPRTGLYHWSYYKLTRLPVRTVMLVTSERLRNAAPAEIAFRVGDDRPSCIPLRTVHLWDFKAEEVLERRQVALYAFVPLMKSCSRARALLANLLDRIMEDVSPRRLQEDVRAGAMILALKRFSRRTVGRVFGGIEDMARIDIGRELIEMGRKRGLAEGVAKGVVKGVVEGRTNAMRADILAALEARFGRVSADVRTRVQAVKTEARLQALHRAAVTAADMTAFRAALPRA